MSSPRPLLPSGLIKLARWRFTLTVIIMTAEATGPAPVAGWSKSILYHFQVFSTGSQPFSNLRARWCTYCFGQNPVGWHVGPLGPQSRTWAPAIINIMCFVSMCKEDATIELIGLLAQGEAEEKSWSASKGWHGSKGVLRSESYVF